MVNTLTTIIFTLIIRLVNCQNKNLRVRQNVTLQDEGYVGYYV